ncbi:hypothetical protein BDW22DRAFT_689459 [Trametopsis cervina]|nr:hypothetical protein BDW22DRAFT_689459 [Trametopsis cervina]
MILKIISSPLALATCRPSRLPRDPAPHARPRRHCSLCVRLSHPPRIPRGRPRSQPAHLGHPPRHCSYSTPRGCRRGPPLAFPRPLPMAAPISPALMARTASALLASHVFDRCHCGLFYCRRHRSPRRSSSPHARLCTAVPTHNSPALANLLPSHSFPQVFTRHAATLLPQRGYRTPPPMHTRAVRKIGARFN